MGEDASRARTGEAPANLAILRRITLNTLKVHVPFPGKKGADMSIRSRQYVASLDRHCLASLIRAAGLTPKVRFPCRVLGGRIFRWRERTEAIH